jgi:hypothetical protein
MRTVITYGSIFILTLILIIGLININVLKETFGNKKGVTIILVSVILMSYFTLVIFPVNSLLNKQILSKKLLQGDKGPRGDRGKSGEPALCKTCGDDLCLKKILFNITNTYNYWRSLNGLNLYPDTYVIKNEFIKDKIRKHCNSSQFKKIIKKYGSNNKKSCPEGLDSCGIYDYLYKMWSTWILIILKYKNGFFFLESDSLTDKDFDGLIEPEDSFQLADIVKYNNSNTNYKIDEVKDLFPFFVIRNTSNSKKLNAHVNELQLQTEPININGKKIWNPEVYSYHNMFTKHDANYDEQISGLNLSVIKSVKNEKGDITYDAPDFNDDFFKVQGTPSRGKLSPFDEIEKYKSWYWGRSERLIPKIIIKQPKDDISFRQKTCYNKKKIKVKITNNFFELFSTKKITQNYTGTNLTPFKVFGSSSVRFLRAKTYLDNEEHHFFKNYRPVGDVIINENEILQSSDSDNKKQCLPNTNNFISNISSKITNINTILVSGDTKAPIDYEMILSSTKTRGINKLSEGFTIWKPIPPQGYKSLGYIVDNRPYPPGDSPPKPSFNIVACIPIDVTLEIDSNIEEIWNNNSRNIDNMTISNNVKLFRNNDIYTFKTENESHFKINNQELCKTYDEILKESPEEPVFNAPEFPKRSQIKDKKYSILRLYD